MNEAHDTPSQAGSRPARAVREDIAEAALQLFLERGFVETTIDDIALAAGISRRTFFRYFATKDDTVLEYIAQTGGRFIERYMVRPDGEPTLAAVQAAVREVLEEVGSETERARALGRLIRETPSLRARHLTIHQQWELDLADAISHRRGAPADDLKSRLLAALAVVAVDVGSYRWAVSDAALLPESVDATFEAIRDPRLWGANALAGAGAGVQ
ncbi:MAG: TetR family transcriptional regulator [Dehalococcoidia bacterium]